MTARPQQGAASRRLAIEAVRRIDQEGAYANLLVPSLLEASELDQRDRNLVTEIAYGATRMRRALDWLVDRFLVSPPAPALRAALRVGAYQLAFMRIPAHAAVSATVSATTKRNRAPVNAILRKVADGMNDLAWPSRGVQVSYPDWILAALEADHGAADAAAAADVMNLAPTVTERPDGYIQDTASQWVVDAVDAKPGELVLDLCAAPGGKATGLAATGARIVAADVAPKRVGLVATNAARLDSGVAPVVADGMAAPFAAASFDRVLVDAPCSGLGVLRRRPDARWRVQADDVQRLAGVQRELLLSGADLVKPGGTLVYSVCTLTQAETAGVAAVIDQDDVWESVPVVGDRWRPWGSGGLVLPQDHDTDGMAVFVWERAS